MGRRLPFALAAVLFGALAPNAVGQECLGLQCPGGLAPEVVDAPVKDVASPRALEKQTVSGFYEFNSPAAYAIPPAIAYVAAPGTIDAAPPEILALPSVQVLTASDRALDTIVVYGPGTVTVSGESARVRAAQAKRSTKAGKQKARAAQEPTGCPVPWFCLYDFDDFVGDRGMWQSTGSWQNLSKFGWNNRAESMMNRRSGVTLLAPGADGGGSRYCARANSADADLSNNDSISNNASSLYNSTSPNYHPTWSCFNPF